MSSINDRLWIWGHPVNSHYGYSNFCPEIKESRITPEAAAAYLGVPNLLMIHYGDQPQPPFEVEAAAFQPLSRVVWSLLQAIHVPWSNLPEPEPDADGTCLDTVLAMARNHDNVSGVILDDFFGRGGQTAALTVPQLEAMQKKLQLPDRKLDLWAVYYDPPSGKTPPEPDVLPYLKHCDVINFWTWNAAELENLEENFVEVRRVADATDCSVVLGCYMFDYGKKRPMPLHLMEKQCRLGREWIEQGQIDGMVFLASCICDIGLEAVEWTRDWIAANQ